MEIISALSVWTVHRVSWPVDLTLLVWRCGAFSRAACADAEHEERRLEQGPMRNGPACCRGATSVLLLSERTTLLCPHRQPKSLEDTSKKFHNTKVFEKLRQLPLKL
jgi:hypothetical protein